MRMQCSSFPSGCRKAAGRKTHTSRLPAFFRVSSINIPRPSRGYFICGQSPIILASASRRANTVCQPRELCYLLPINGFNNFPSSAVLRLCLLLIMGAGYILLSFLHSFPLYLRNILGTKILDSCTYIVILDTFRIS